MLSIQCASTLVLCNIMAQRYHYYPRRCNFYRCQDGEDVFSLASEPVEHRDGNNTRLVEILREENATLKKELESYYNRVRKLQKVRNVLIL